MKLFDMKSGMTPRRVRIILAEKGFDILSVEIDMQAAVRWSQRSDRWLSSNRPGMRTNAMTGTRQHSAADQEVGDQQGDVGHWRQPAKIGSA